MADSNARSDGGAGTDGRPNVLWVFMDDVCPWMSCYGHDAVETEHVDALADRGVRFDRAYSTAPVCTPSRSAVVTGMYQTTIGAHNHYSSFETWRGIEMDEWDPTHLGVRTMPEIFRSAGYYTFNEGKNHYNFVDRDRMLYDRKGDDPGFHGATGGTEWSGRDPGQPFFGQVQLTGGKATVSDDVDRVDPESVTVPPYYPDHPVYREEIAHHYDTIQEMDRILGDVVAALRRDDLYEDTVVWFFSDHGMRLPRHKQFCYEGGIRVPMVVAGPGVPAGVAREDLVSGIDVGPTSLSLAGIDVPRHVQGRDALDEDFHRDHVVAARDRCDYTIDRIRAVVGDRYKYVRNFMTDRPYLQPQYRDGEEFVTVLKDLHERGELDEVQSRFVSEERPAEELYDLRTDPHETENLVHSPEREHREALGRLRNALHRWIAETGDRGEFPESEAALSAVLDRWGDDAVNPEYDEVRRRRGDGE
ncbi:MAG: sulfatase [Halobacteriaceae archaeon]